jgi:hypothetical protein
MRVGGCLVLALVAGCASPIAPVVSGSWGGSQVSLTLDRSGGTVIYACATGTIDSTWTLSADGVFAATGEHYFAGGPVPPGGGAPHPARYSGQVNGYVLTLTVTVIDLNQTLGPFTLVRDGPPVRLLCL